MLNALGSLKYIGGEAREGILSTLGRREGRGPEVYIGGREGLFSTLEAIMEYTEGVQYMGGSVGDNSEDVTPGGLHFHTVLLGY